MTYQEAIELGSALLREHNLEQAGWKVACMNTRAVTARCDYRTKTIKLSINFLYREDHKIRNSILHEIAHAICGYKHAHNQVWILVAQRIGCTGDRCAML